MSVRKKLTNEGIKSFLAEGEITSGTTKIPNSILYYEYAIRWKDPHKRKKASKIHFFRNLSKIFKRWRHGYTRGYFLNNVFDLSADNLMKSRIFLIHYENGISKHAKART